MKKKVVLLSIVASSLMLFNLASCKASGSSVYANDFVNSLVSLKKLTPSDGKYVFEESFVEKATEYTYTLTCTEDASYDYIFNSKLSKKIKSGSIEGYIYSDIDFIWGRFATSLFTGSADLISGSVETVPVYLFYGLVYNNDGTLVNSSYFQTYKGLDSNFSSIPVVDTAWSMTMIQTAHLNALTQEVAGVYVW